MANEAIHTEVCAVLQETVAIHSGDALVNGTTCPATDLAGIDSQQLLQLTGELAHRLDIAIPYGENVFWASGLSRARTVDDIATRLAEIAAA